MPHGGASTMMEKAGLVSINKSLGKLNYGNPSPGRFILQLHSLHRFHADPQNTSSRNTATREVPRNFNVNLPRLTSEHALFSSDPVTGTLQLRSFRSYCRSAQTRHGTPSERVDSSSSTSTEPSNTHVYRAYVLDLGRRCAASPRIRRASAWHHSDPLNRQFLLNSQCYQWHLSVT